MKKLVVLFVCLFVVMLLTAVVLESYAQPGGGIPPAPPFVTACASLSEGAYCSFSGREGAVINGTCTERTNQMGKTELVCFNETFFKEMEVRGERQKPGEMRQNAAPY